MVRRPSHSDRGGNAGLCRALLETASEGEQNESRYPGTQERWNGTFGRGFPDGMRARAQYWQRPSRSWWFPGILLGDERWGYQIFQLAIVQSGLAVLPVAI
jgi:hypothetical protein